MNIVGNWSSEHDEYGTHAHDQIPRNGRSWDWNEDESNEDFISDDYESSDADNQDLEDIPEIHLPHLHHHEHQDIDLEEGNDFNLFALPIVIGPRQTISM